MKPRFLVLIATCLAAAASSATSAELVQNGSLETLAGPFVNSGYEYMQLGNGSTFISGWTVSTSSGHIALGHTPTDDGQSAANGTYFVDLSGFGAESPDGALNQSIGTVAGATYTFSIDLAAINSGVVSASVGGAAITLTSGPSFTVGGTPWKPWSGTFIGDPLDTTPLLTIQDLSPGSDIDFVDDISVTGPAPGASVPEPAAWALMIGGMGLVASALRRQRALGRA